MLLLQMMQKVFCCTPKIGLRLRTVMHSTWLNLLVLLKDAFKGIEQVASEASARADQRWKQTKKLVNQAEKTLKAAGKEAKGIYLNAKLSAQIALNDASEVVAHFDEKLSESLNNVKDVFICS